MGFRIKKQTDHLLTEAVVEMPATVDDVNEFLRSAGATAQLKVLYNEGGIIGISFDQKTKLSEAKATEIRKIAGVETEEI